MYVYIVSIICYCRFGNCLHISAQTTYHAVAVAESSVVGYAAIIWVAHVNPRGEILKKK